MHVWLLQKSLCQLRSHKYKIKYRIVRLHNYINQIIYLFGFTDYSFLILNCLWSFNRLSLSAICKNCMTNIAQRVSFIKDSLKSNDLSQAHQSQNYADLAHRQRLMKIFQCFFKIITNMS
jgi:hypothetical protein